MQMCRHRYLAIDFIYHTHIYVTVYLSVYLPSCPSSYLRSSLSLSIYLYRMYFHISLYVYTSVDAHSWEHNPSQGKGYRGCMGLYAEAWRHAKERWPRADLGTSAEPGGLVELPKSGLGLGSPHTTSLENQGMHMNMEVGQT